MTFFYTAQEYLTNDHALDYNPSYELMLSMLN